MVYRERGTTSITVGWKIRWIDAVAVVEPVTELLSGENRVGRVGGGDREEAAGFASTMEEGLASRWEGVQNGCELGLLECFCSGLVG